MTAFMHRVADLVEAETGEPVEPPVLRTRPSAATPVNEGADRHVAVRAYTEQLLCEANAVLADAGEHLGLIDEVGAGELAFSVHYRGRALRISTRVADGLAVARIAGDGIPPGPARELTGPDAVADLLVALLAGAGAGAGPGPGSG